MDLGVWATCILDKLDIPHLGVVTTSESVFRNKYLFGAIMGCLVQCTSIGHTSNRHISIGPTWVHLDALRHIVELIICTRCNECIVENTSWTYWVQLGAHVESTIRCWRKKKVEGAKEPSCIVELEMWVPRSIQVWKGLQVQDESCINSGCVKYAKELKIIQKESKQDLWFVIRSRLVTIGKIALAQ